MIVTLSKTAQELGRKAAHAGAEAIRQAIAARGQAFIILATGASQFDTLESLIAEPGIDWTKVTVFHLDEYIGMADTHEASFRRYLKTRFIDRVDGLGSAVLVQGDAPDLNAELARIAKAISACQIDVAFVGIGENGHLAFNDPPADFETMTPYIVVDLDEKCRRQQFNEGWFPSFADVPTRAISMSVQQILKSTAIICAVPDARKADAVKGALEGPVSNLCPASILQTHDGTIVFLDTDSASQLGPNQMAALGVEA